MITFNSSTPWSYGSTGPEINVPQIYSTANHVWIDLKEQPDQNIRRRFTGIFNNGATTQKPFYEWIHTNNLIQNSTTRSKTILRLTWRTEQEETLDTKYYKIGFEEIETVPAAPGVPTVQELDYSFISFEGQTYDLVEEASNGITVTPRTDSSGSITASRVNDDGEILIPISANSLWGSENNQKLYGPVFNLKQSDPDAHYVAISCTSSGNTNIITQNLGAAVFENGIASRAIDKTWAHELNIISGSTTRSKTVVELVWKNISNETIKTEYYKIGFVQL